MLIDMKTLMEKAEEGKFAVGSFNCTTLEMVRAVVLAAEETRKPVILSFPQVHERTIPLAVIAPVLIHAAKNSTVPICVHLDHGTTIDYIRNALELGIRSVMYDGSHLPLKENIATTKAVVKMAAQYGADVEAELGGIAGDESGIATEVVTHANQTDPDEAAQFVRLTGITTLAASIGTAHGFYTESPKINFDRIEEIRQRTGIPLVMHGGSGVSKADITVAIAKGIRKINYYSYMAKAGVTGTKALLAEKEVSYFHEIASAATNAMKKDVKKAIQLFHPGKQNF